MFVEINKDRENLTLGLYCIYQMTHEICNHWKEEICTAPGESGECNEIRSNGKCKNFTPYVVCNKCGKIFNRIPKFCPECGEPA